MRPALRRHELWCRWNAIKMAMPIRCYTKRGDVMAADIQMREHCVLHRPRKFPRASIRPALDGLPVTVCIHSTWKSLCTLVKGCCHALNNLQSGLCILFPQYRVHQGNTVCLIGVLQQMPHTQVVNQGIDGEQGL